MKGIWLIGVIAAAALAAPARAEVKPHGLFSEGAVLQRGIRLPVWGTARPGERVTVSIQGQTVSTTADDGRWKLWLKPLQAGGPYTLRISGENSVEIPNVLVGEVWICSGQSNMEWPLWNTATGEQDAARVNDPQLRLLKLERATADAPVRDVTARWTPATPETARNFTAVGYYFGRDLRKALGVPVGLIQTAWGGTVAEAWTSRPTLESVPGLGRLLVNHRAARRNYLLALMNHQRALAEHRVAAEKARREGRLVPQAPPAPRDPSTGPNRPAVLYNAMIAPLVPFGLRGAIWYQGESNAGRAHEYQTLFPAMIRNWRQAWGQGDFPFLLVQLAPFMQIRKEPAESAWAELREAQRLTTLRLPKVGMAVITDLGDERDIHPRRKEPVGGRLALLARAIAYGDRKTVANGPTLRSLEIDGNRAIVRFRDTAGGLVARGGALTGFTVAGPDGKWHNAEAAIDGDRVIVSCASVPRPVAVRYGWADYPVVNLFNGAGLPASPFRTDTYPLTTQGR